MARGIPARMCMCHNVGTWAHGRMYVGLRERIITVYMAEPVLPCETEPFDVREEGLVWGLKMHARVRLFTAHRAGVFSSGGGAGRCGGV